MSASEAKTPISEEKASSDENAFCLSEHLKLIGQMSKVCASNQLSSGHEVDANVVSLTAYTRSLQRLVKEGKISEHFSQWDTIYAEHRKAVKVGVENDIWLREGSIVIRIEEKKAPKKLMLSLIYNIALKLKDAIPEKDAASQQELIYPESMMLHIYRIFRERARGYDYKDLSVPIKGLEDDFGITPEAATPDTGGFDIGAIMGKMFKGNGTDSGMPDIGKIMGSIGKDGKLGDQISKLTQNADSQTPQDALKGIIKSLGDGELVNHITSIAEGAIGKGSAPSTPSTSTSSSSSSTSGSSSTSQFVDDE